MKAAVVHPAGKIKYKSIAAPTIKKSTDTIVKITPTINLGSVEACGSCLFCNHPSQSNCENNIPNH